MRAADMKAETITIGCPDCGELATDPRTGSTMLEVGDLERLPDTITCRCGTEYRVRKDAQMVRV